MSVVIDCESKQSVLWPQVHDIYSAEVVAASAGAPGEWLRQALGQPGVRVVLLQTPAMACLHRRRLQQQDDALRRECPPRIILTTKLMAFCRTTILFMPKPQPRTKIP